jgi:hypothetical protein
VEPFGLFVGEGMGVAEGGGVTMVVPEFGALPVGRGEMVGSGTGVPVGSRSGLIKSLRTFEIWTRFSRSLVTSSNPLTMTSNPSTITIILFIVGHILAGVWIFWSEIAFNPGGGTLISPPGLEKSAAKRAGTVH